ncbi:MAG: cytochrome b N-terminal domain-containing protein [Trueperaceae bacterium]|nr:cytochrome b N-terminal domain-containing protein [Trueperaceae bacterium]
MAERSGAAPGRGFWRAIDERVGISGLKYHVPDHAQGLGYSLGAITLVSYLVLVVTGIWMGQFYNPIPDEARASLRYLLTSAPAGLFARNLHYWAANAMLLTALLHMLRVQYTGAFKRPREANWLVGIGLLALTIGLVFTGSVLKWDQEAVEGIAHNVEIANLLGGVGVWFSPSFSGSIPILTRLYIAHVSILPILLAALFAIHALLVKQHGLAPNALAGRDATTRATAGEPSRGTFLGHLGVAGLYSLIGLGLLVFLAVTVPAQLGPAPVEGIELTKPWWMFLPVFAVENAIGLGGLLWASVAIFLALALVPLLDRSSYLHPARRRAILLIYLVFAIVIVGLGIYAKVAPGADHLGMGG